MLLTFGLSMMIPVIALLYVKLEKFILRRAGVPPIEEHIASLKLPPGVRIVPFYDQSFVIDGTIHTVEKNLFEGFILVTIVLLLFLGNLRAALITAAIIPFSMLIGFLGMRLFGISANLMSLGAIDFGMIVDGAVVMMENSIHRLDERHGRETPLESVRAIPVRG